MLEVLIDKLNTARNSEPRVVFGYEYINSRLDDYISTTNLRMEMFQVGNGKVLHIMAAPVLEINRGVPEVIFADSNLVQVTEGPRKNIVLPATYLKEGEVAHPATACYCKEVTEHDSKTSLQRMLDFLTGPSYPGLDMRMPDLFRVTKSPERLRLNLCPELLDALGLAPGASVSKVQEKFLAKLPSIAAATQDGYAVPFSWVHAGGMVCASAAGVGKTKPHFMYVRSMDFFANWCKVKGWNITCN